jgi:hypothetical protein
MKIEDKGDRGRIRLSAGREAWLFRFVMMNLFARQHIVGEVRINRMNPFSFHQFEVGEGQNHFPAIYR